MGYYQNKNDFIIALYNGKTQSTQYYLYDNKSIKLIDEKTFINKNVKKVNLPDRELEKKIKSENNEIGKYLISGAVNYKEDKYIVAFHKDYWIEELYIYDKHDNKLVKIEMDNLYAIVAYGETFIFYDDISDTVYFSGYKEKDKTKPKTDKGLYGYNFKTENYFIIYKINDLGLICPYRIPNTNFLIFLNQKNNLTEILIANLEN